MYNARYVHGLLPPAARDKMQQSLLKCSIRPETKPIPAKPHNPAHPGIHELTHPTRATPCPNNHSITSSPVLIHHLAGVCPPPWKPLPQPRRMRTPRQSVSLKRRAHRVCTMRRYLMRHTKPPSTSITSAAHWKKSAKIGSMKRMKYCRRRPSGMQPARSASS
jgi:hypothetical protein